MYKNLNPAWNESFSILIRGLEQNVIVKVWTSCPDPHQTTTEIASSLNINDSTPFPTSL